MASPSGLRQKQSISAVKGQDPSWPASRRHGKVVRIVDNRRCQPQQPGTFRAVKAKRVNCRSIVIRSNRRRQGSCTADSRYCAPNRNNRRNGESAASDRPLHVRYIVMVGHPSARGISRVPRGNLDGTHEAGNLRLMDGFDRVASCLPSQRERIAQREFKLRRWACEPDCDHTKNSGVHPCSPRGSGGVQRSSDEARDESRARAMNNMTKIMSAVNSLSAETEKLTLDEARLAGKCERSRTTDSGVWCEELSRYCVTSPDDRIQPVPEPQAWRRLPAKRKAVNLPAVSSSESNCSSREHCELQASEDGQSLLSVDKTIGDDEYRTSTTNVLQDIEACRYKRTSDAKSKLGLVKSETRTLRRERRNLSESSSSSWPLFDAHRNQRCNSADPTAENAASCIGRKTFERVRSALDMHSERKQMENNSINDDVRRCHPMFSDETIVKGNYVASNSAHNTSRSRSAVSKRRNSLVYSHSDPTSLTFADGNGENCPLGVLQPDNDKSNPLVDTGSVFAAGSLPGVPIIYQCVCKKCKRLNKLYPPRYFTLGPEIRSTKPVFVTGSFLLETPQRLSSKPSRKHRMERMSSTRTESRSLTSDFSSRIVLNAFLGCFRCLGDDSSDSSDSGGSDSDNDDGDGGGDQSEGYQEHGDGVSVDEDSDGGDSGSESGEVSMNSAELYDDSNNVLDIKNPLADGGESDGGPNSGDSDSDSLTELRSRSKKGSDEEDDTEDDDAFGFDEDFDDSLDSILIYEE